MEKLTPTLWFLSEGHHYIANEPIWLNGKRVPSFCLYGGDPRSGCEEKIGEFETLEEAVADTKREIDPLDLMEPGDWWVGDEQVSPNAFLDRHLY